MAEILTGARKYRVGLILAHQELRQLQKDSEVAGAVMSNPYTRIVFRVGDDDASKLASGFASFELEDLQNLETGKAVARVERSDSDFNLNILLPDDPPESEAFERRKAVIAASRARYATPRAEVEAALYRDIPPDEPKPPLKSKESKPTPGSDEPKTHPAQLEGPKGPSQETLSHGNLEPPPSLKAPSLEDTGGEETLHTRIRERIARSARALGYTVEPEERIPGTDKRIDLVLRRGTLFIACEVSSKNEPADEVKNIEKCFKAGFLQIVVVSDKAATLLKVKEMAKARLPAEGLARVSFKLPDEFLKELASWAQQDPAGAAVEQAKSHKHDIYLGSLAHMSETERGEREKVMLKDLARRMKGKRSH